MRSIAAVGIATVILAGCARTEATRTSANTMIVDAGAAPVCGSTGAARVASRTAAIETIKAGYDRYVITGGRSENNVRSTTLPGSSQTYGTVSGGTLTATTTYTPGPTIVAGSHDRSLSVVMFRKGDPGYEQGLDARQALGPEWQEIVKGGVVTCLG